MISMFVYMSQTAAWPVDRFRATLDRILDETKLSQAGLAALVPMDQSQLSRWKSGSSRPKFESLKTLGEALRRKYPSLAIGPNELLESAGYAPPEPVLPTMPTDSDAGAAGPDDRRVTVDLPAGPDLTLEEAIREVEEKDGPLTRKERTWVDMLDLMGYDPDVIGGMVILSRRVARQAQQDTGRDRKRA